MNARNIGGRVLAAATLGLLLVVGTLPAAAQQPTGAKSKLVLQVSDGDAAKWNLALNNAKNVQVDLGATNVDIEIVAYGPGIGMLKADSVVGNRVGEALASGVKVVACENTMHGQKLTKADMLGGIGYAPAGVVEIMQKQQQGWAYIRP
jgi:intracellular sulfur oxidation DsrE/DsrF family protein